MNPLKIGTVPLGKLDHFVDLQTYTSTVGLHSSHYTLLLLALERTKHSVHAESATYCFLFAAAGAFAEPA